MRVPAYITMSTNSQLQRRANNLITKAKDDYDGDGNIDYRYSTTNTYDRKGNPLTSIYESDYGADGTIDFRQETVYEYLDGCKSVIGISSSSSEFSLDNQLDTMANEESALFGTFSADNFI